VSWCARCCYATGWRSAEDPGKRTSEDEELVMSTQDIVEAWEQEKEARGFAKGLEEGLVLTYCARFGPIPEDVQRLIEATRDPQTLRGWYGLLQTATADAFAQAVRAAGRGKPTRIS
jgi:hypothetical protein